MRSVVCCLLFVVCVGVVGVAVAVAVAVVVPVPVAGMAAVVAIAGGVLGFP